MSRPNRIAHPSSRIAPVALAASIISTVGGCGGDSPGQSSSTTSSIGGTSVSTGGDPSSRSSGGTTNAGRSGAVGGLTATGSSVGGTSSSMVAGGATDAAGSSTTGGVTAAAGSSTTGGSTASSNVGSSGRATAGDRSTGGSSPGGAGGHANTSGGISSASGASGTGASGASGTGGSSGSGGSGVAGTQVTGGTSIASGGLAGNAGSPGTSPVSVPALQRRLADRWEEAWLGSPAVADLDADGKREIIVPRDGALVVWNADGTLLWKFSNTPGRIWSSPVVADFRDDARLEIAVASRGQVFLFDANGRVLSGFPITWENEIRSLAAGDVDGDGQLDLVATPARSSPTDVINAWHADGSVVAGFPPNAAGVSGCSGNCYLAGCYDQNLAVGDLDGDPKMDVVAPHDNAYASFHQGSGVAFDANPMFQGRPKTPGVRYLHDLALAQQGYADDEDTALQAHFTNTAPAIADVDGDGTNEIVMLGSVQNAAQTDRLKGVALWVVRRDASRLPGWESPFHAPDYIAGLWDYGDNMVAATNQVTVADIDVASPGPEFVFAGFDGKIHAVTADKRELWSYRYTSDPNVLTGGVIVGDLSQDGVPEIVFNSYSVDPDKGALFVIDAGGHELHRIALPRRGAMPVPTMADTDGDGKLEIVVSLKDASDRVESVLVYTVASSSVGGLLWPTGRGNLLRNGWVKAR
jgi:hypothetical protein